MPLDVLGRTRATMKNSTSFPALKKVGNHCNLFRARDRPFKCKSLTCTDYVPALCTHRPSHLPIEWSDGIFGLSRQAIRKID
eukprot:maker-scaffold_114-snap-gene-0.18-mRNA-1 protein AED:0.46 eAED:0.50 QI:0/0/0/1/0/0/2/0/81